MKITEQFDKIGEYFSSNIGSLFLTALATVKGMITNPAFLLLSTSTIGFIQVFTFRMELMLDLAFVVLVCFGVMTFLGMVKHIKEGEFNAMIFLKKTIVQFVVMVSVILLGYAASIVIAVAFKFATETVGATNPVPGLALYFIFAGYGIMFTYYFIKSCDLIEQIIPELLPKAFSAPFRKFRQTGDYRDLLSFSNEPDKEETK